MKPGKELDILVANAMGLVPCEEWRAIEWDGVVGVRCGNEEHYEFRKGVGCRDLCYAMGIRESNESLEKSGEWKHLPILTDLSGGCSMWQLGPHHYSTDIAATWEVVEELFTFIPQQDLHFQHLAANQKGDDALWGVGSCHRKEFIYAKTLPHAVCLFTLKFYEEKS